MLADSGVGHFGPEIGTDTVHRQDLAPPPVHVLGQGTPIRNGGVLVDNRQRSHCSPQARD